MDNLVELAWTKSFDMIIVGILCLFAYGIRLIRKSPIKKNHIAILIIVMAYFVYVGLPFIHDFIEADLYSIHGTISEKISSTYKYSRTVYSYTVLDNNGNEMVLFVGEENDKLFDLNIGEQYNIMYYKNSRAISCVEHLP